MKKITLVPDIYSQRENPGMYCNYARMKAYEERCFVCSNNCEHAGKKEYPFWVLFLFICPIWAHF